MNRQSCIDFLRQSLPPADFVDYPEALFLAFIDHALLLREAAPWCAQLEDELFLHYVLCPRVNDEDLSFHRGVFYDELWPRVAGLAVEEAVLEVNRWCHENASYQAQDDRTASPLTVYRNASGRCGEESAFLVAALRSVGIPARQVYAPRWSHCDDNHAWAEALCGSQWRFLGACEPEPVLNRGWFNTAAGRAVLIHSRIFGAGQSPLHGALISNENGVALYNQTSRYTPVKEYAFQALRNGVPAAGATISLHILNEAYFFPIAHLAADRDGRAAIALGRGDIWASAALDGLMAEGLCPMEQGKFTLELTAAPATGQAEFDFRAPAAPPAPAPLDEGQKTVRREVLARGNALRQEKIDGWYRGGDPMRRAARGNWAEIDRFSRRDDNPLRHRLLSSLSPKDLRDVTAQTLEDALAVAAPHRGRYSWAFYDQYLLCPRVAFEGLTLHSKPPAVRQVLALRHDGVPARLRPLDGTVEVWQENAFHPAVPEESGTLCLTKAPGAAPVYRQSWSLARQESEGWRLLNPELSWQSDSCYVNLPVGTYRLITAVRLPSGDQFATKTEFDILPEGMVSLSLTLREYSLQDLLYRRPLPPIPAEGTGNALTALTRPALLFWLEEGGEPTEHVLGELMAAQSLPPVVFFLRSPDAVKQPTLARTLEKHPDIKVFYDDWAYDLESLSRLLGTDGERPPLAVVWSGTGYAVYAESGYRVGSVELLARIAVQI